MTVNPEFLEQARHALQETDSEKAETFYMELITSIEALYGKSQKDVANELQRIAKFIETEGDLNVSMEFKQRTCEVLLKRGMEERQRNRAALPPMKAKAEVAEPVKLPWLRSEILLLAVPDFDSQSTFFKEAAGLPLLHFSEERGRKMALFDFGAAYRVLLFESRQLSGFMPLLLTEDFEESQKRMRVLGFVAAPASLELPRGTVSIFRDRLGNSYGLSKADFINILKS